MGTSRDGGNLRQGQIKTDFRVVVVVVVVVLDLLYNSSWRIASFVRVSSGGVGETPPSLVKKKHMKEKRKKHYDILS